MTVTVAFKKHPVQKAGTRFRAAPLLLCTLQSGSEKGVFWKRGPYRKVHFLEILENLEILEILENPGLK